MSQVTTFCSTKVMLFILSVLFWLCTALQNIVLIDYQKSNNCIKNTTQTTVQKLYALADHAVLRQSVYHYFT